MRVACWKKPVFYLVAATTTTITTRVLFGIQPVMSLLSSLSYSSYSKSALYLINYERRRSKNLFRMSSSNDSCSSISNTYNTDDAAANTCMISWRRRLESSIGKCRKIRSSNYVQIATVTEDGEPRCRTVVFRGFLRTLPSMHPMGGASSYCDDKPCVMKMCTDLRSQKVREISHRPIGELVWWFPKTSEQYRIRGTVTLVGGDENDDSSLWIARKELWRNLSDPARESFLDDDSNVAGHCGGGRDENGKVVPPPNNFLLMLLEPKHVDYLLLGPNQYRQIDQLPADAMATSSSNNEAFASSPPLWSSREVDP